MLDSNENMLKQDKELKSWVKVESARLGNYRICIFRQEEKRHAYK